MGRDGLVDPARPWLRSPSMRAAAHELAVVIPVDMPLLTPDALRLLVAACRDAAVAQAGPLPCAVARHTLSAFETGERRLRTVLAGLDTATSSSTSGCWRT